MAGEIKVPCQKKVYVNGKLTNNHILTVHPSGGLNVPEEEYFSSSEYSVNTIYYIGYNISTIRTNVFAFCKYLFIVMVITQNIAEYSPEKPKRLKYIAIYYHVDPVAKSQKYGLDLGRG